jgi:hypothetical protein
MHVAKRPVRADLGDDPKKNNFVLAAEYAERYNSKMLELGVRGRSDGHSYSASDTAAGVALNPKLGSPRRKPLR